MRPSGKNNGKAGRDLSTLTRNEGPETKGGNGKGGAKHYDLSLPPDVFEALQEVATRRKTTFAEVVRTCIRLGLLVDSTQDSENEAFLYQKGDKTHRIMIV
jgi:hypothetical protein